MSAHFKGRREDRRLITGNGKYTADWNQPGQLYAAFLRSDRAHAQIVSINVKPALSAPGVAAVLTADPARREAYYAQANDAIRNLVPLVPLVQASAIAAARSDITGFVASPLEYELAAPVSAPGRSTTSSGGPSSACVPAMR